MASQKAPRCWALTRTPAPGDRGKLPLGSGRPGAGGLLILRVIRRQPAFRWAAPEPGAWGTGEGRGRLGHDVQLNLSFPQDGTCDTFYFGSSAFSLGRSPSNMTTAAAHSGNRYPGLGSFPGWKKKVNK